MQQYWVQFYNTLYTVNLTIKICSNNEMLSFEKD
jgi:hypothetical protein